MYILWDRIYDALFYQSAKWTLFSQIVDRKLSVDGLKALGAKKYEGDEKAIATFNEMVAECESIADPDTCELGPKLADCMIKAAVKRGIDPKKGIQS